MEIFKQTAFAVGGLLLCAFSVAVQAATTETPPADTGWGWVIEGAGEFGGDDVATIYFDDDSDQAVKTGQGVTLALGAHYRATSNWDVRGTLGYKYVTTKAKNADINIGRVVVESVADYFFAKKWFLGGGLTYHSGTQFNGDDFLPDIDFDDALGVTIEAGWSFVGVTYTFMDYKDEFGNKYNASNIGLTFTGRF